MLSKQLLPTKDRCVDYILSLHENNNPNRRGDLRSSVENRSCRSISIIFIHGGGRPQWFDYTKITTQIVGAISDRPLKIEAVEAFLLFSCMVVTEGNGSIIRKLHPLCLCLVRCNPETPRFRFHSTRILRIELIYTDFT